MPNRLIKETIRTSRNVNNLSDFQFRLWIHLITFVDDYGRGSADPELIKGLVFPRRKSITEKQIVDALTSLATTGMIRLYEADGESYFYFPNWEKHQQIRAKKSKYPEPDINGNQMISNVPVIQYESNTESESNTEYEKDSTEQPSRTVLTLPLQSGEDYPITEDFVEEMQSLYPAVDVMQELREMKAWCIANPRKRKTKDGVKRFVTTWLGKEQDRGGTRQSGQRRITTFMDV